MQLPEPELRANERDTLDQFLDFQRAVMMRKLLGLTHEQANRRVLDSSTMTISGLVKHLARVEDLWFQERLHGRDMPEPWCSAPSDDPDWDFHSAAADQPEELLRLYAEACERSRTAAAGVDLDFAPLQSNGEEISLRWILVHMIEETARHAGHADLIREAIDGATGDWSIPVPPVL